MAGSGKDRRCSVAAFGFDDDSGFINPDFVKMLAGNEAMIITSDDEWSCRSIPETGCRLLKQAALADKIKELLGVALAREGPEPLAAATTQNDWGDVGHCFLSYLYYR